jgi:hypothetical protein
MTLSLNRRAYLRSVANLPLETQREMARDANASIVVAHGVGKNGLPRRSNWIGALLPGDVAWVARLDVLGAPKGERGGKLAVVDWSSVVAQILGRGAVIMEWSTGVTSEDGAQWKRRVEWAMKQVASGRMSRATAKKVGAKGGAVLKSRAVTTRWKSPGMKAEFDRWAAVWRDSQYANDQEAADAIEVPDLQGRKYLCRRLFDRRQPRNKRAGGRSRKMD